MKDKQRVQDQNLTQADGLRDAPEVVENLEAPELEAEPGGESGGSGLPVEPADERVKRLESELDEARDRHLRLAAEFDNFRKRVARERVELADRAQAAFVVKMLDVLDDLDRLVAGETQAAQEGPLYDATVLINRKLRKELEAAGLERIDPVGKPFDPTFHEAVSIIPAPTEAQAHTVSATFQTGYGFKGSLVRPARVQVYSDQAQD